jgi:hypothetical protein
VEVTKIKQVTFGGDENKFEDVITEIMNFLTKDLPKGIEKQMKEMERRKDE